MNHPRAGDFTQAQKDASDTMRILQSVRLPAVADRTLLNLLLDTPLYPTLFSIVECGGVFAGNAFLQWLIEKLAVKGVAADDTLATFQAKKKVDLSVVASDTTDMEMLVLNPRTAPNVPVAWAVRMSMSIPMIWREVVWQDAWSRQLEERRSQRAARHEVSSCSRY